MGALTTEQLELLQRAGGGIPMWGGSVMLNRLRRDVELLFAMRLIEPSAPYRYTLSALGAEVLVAAGLAVDGAIPDSPDVAGSRASAIGTDA